MKKKRSGRGNGAAPQTGAGPGKGGKRQPWKPSPPPGCSGMGDGVAGCGVSVGVQGSGVAP